MVVFCWLICCWCSLMLFWCVFSWRLLLFILLLMLNDWDWKLCVFVYRVMCWWIRNWNWVCVLWLCWCVIFVVRWWWWWILVCMWFVWNWKIWWNVVCWLCWRFRWSWVCCCEVWLIFEDEVLNFVFVLILVMFWYGFVGFFSLNGGRVW